MINKLFIESILNLMVKRKIIDDEERELYKFGLKSFKLKLLYTIFI